MPATDDGRQSVRSVGVVGTGGGKHGGNTQVHFRNTRSSGRNQTCDIRFTWTSCSNSSLNKREEGERVRWPFGRRKAETEFSTTAESR